MTPWVDFLKAKIQSDGILDKLKLRVMIRGDLKNKELVGDTWSPKSLHEDSEIFLGRCN